MLHWLAHVAGVDTQLSYWYAFYSGVSASAAGWVSAWGVLFTAILAYRRWSCRYAWWCPRHADHPLTDPDSGESRSYCHRHHPGTRHRHWTPDRIEDVWRRHLERHGQ